MRITIDATPVLLRSAGVKNYIYHLAQSLQKAIRGTATGDEIRVFPFLDGLGDLNHEGSPLGFAGTWPRIALIQALKLFGSPLLTALIGETDVFHASNQVRCAPLGVKLTATIHDLTVWLMPDVHTPANVRADYAYAERILAKADALIAVSENTRRDAIRVLGIPSKRITTIYSGIAPEYFDAKPTLRQRPYVLFVGTIEPRKNLNGLLDAWSLVREELRKEFDLVIAGPMGWGHASMLARIRAEATYLGYVPETQMPGLMAGATVFVYPSFYEGFGFPVAQALAAKVPVVTSNTSSLPEVARDGALLVDPKSPDEIAAAITRLLESDAIRAKLAGYGRASAERFRWERCAEETLAFFRRVAGT
jgi:glycosyltransferase involved in cell wall biosynthesis